MSTGGDFTFVYLRYNEGVTCLYLRFNEGDTFLNLGYNEGVTCWYLGYDETLFSNDTRVRQSIRKYSWTTACDSQFENAPGQPRVTVN